MDYTEIERQLAERVAASARAGQQAVLQGLDVDQPRVAIEGKAYGRVGRYEAPYSTMAGAVEGARIE